MSIDLVFVFISQLKVPAKSCLVIGWEIYCVRTRKWRCLYLQQRHRSLVPFPAKSADTSASRLLLNLFQISPSLSVLCHFRQVANFLLRREIQKLLHFMMYHRANKLQISQAMVVGYSPLTGVVLVYISLVGR
jgi:hypothetical protein